MNILATGALVAVLGLACWFDLRERRIPNALTLAGAAAALALRAPSGWGSLLQGATGAGLAVLLMLAPFVLGFLGGGDVKLLGAAGAFLGANRLVGALLLVGVVGGLLAVLEAARRRTLVHALANTYGFAKAWVFFGRAGVRPTLDSPAAMSVPYGVAIAIGTLIWWFYGGAGL